MVSDSFLPPVIIELTADTAGASTGIDELISALTRMQSTLEEIVPAVTDGFAAISDSAKVMSTTVSEAADVTKTGIRQVASAVRALTKAVDGMATTVPEGFQTVIASAKEMTAVSDEFTVVGESAQELAATAGTAFAGLSEEMNAVGKAATTMAAEVDASTAAAEGSAVKTESAMTRMSVASDGAFASVTESLKKFGETIGLVGGGAFLYEAIKGTIAFQAEMVKLNTQAGVSKDQLQSLGDGVLQLAGQVGLRPDSLAEALFHVESNFASLGITAPKALEIVKIAAEGAQVGGANLIDVTNALTAAVASGIPGVENMSQAMGALNAIVGAGDMTMQDLADAFGSGMVATVKGFGLSLADVGAALATFGDNNIRGAVAGTDLRMAVQALAAPVSTASSELHKLGMTQSTLADDMRKGGLKLALEDLSDRFKKTGITADEQGQVITELFGKKAGAGLQVLMDQVDRFESKFPAIADGAGKFGDAWTTASQTLRVQFDQLKAGLEALGVKIGTMLMPYAEKFLGWVKDGVNWLTQHKGAVEAIAGAIGGLLVAAIVALGSAIEMTPVGWLATGIMALGAAVTYAYTHSKTFRDIVDDLGKLLGRAFTAAAKEAGQILDWFRANILPPVKEAVRDLFEWLKAHKDEFRDAWRQLVKDVEIVLEAFKTNVLPLVRDAIKGLIDWFRAHKQEFKELWDDEVRGIQATIVWFATVVLPGLKTAIKDLIDWFQAHKEDFRAAWDKTVKDVRALAQWLNDNVLTWLRDRISEFVSWWHAHSTEITEVWTTTWQLVGAAVDIWWKGVMQPTLALMEALWRVTWGAIKDVLVLAWDAISGVTTMGMHWILNTVGVILDILTGNWGRVWQDLSDMTRQAMRDVVNVIQSVGSDIGGLLWDAGVNLIKGLMGGMRSVLGDLKSLLGDITSSIPNWKGPADKDAQLLTPAGQSIMDGLMSGIGGRVPELRSQLFGITNQISAQWTGPGSGAASGWGVGMAGPGLVVNNYFQIEGSVLSENNLRDLVQEQMLRLGMNNSQTWASFGRH